MNTKFEIGQKVICIHPERDYEDCHPHKGETYTVSGYHETIFDTRPLISVEELADGGRHGFHEYRFEAK